MKKESIYKYRRGIAFLFLFLFVTPALLLFFAINPVNALIPIEVSSEVANALQEERNAAAGAEWSWAKAWEELKDNLSKAGSKAYHSALNKALKTIAYDTATWIGSGGEGQEPLFIREGWGEYLTNVADNAAGTFLEDLMAEGGFEDFNLCEPSIGAKLNISLGLKQYAKPSAPDCTFSEMTDSWSQAIQNPNFINDIQNMFDPVSNDVGITFNAYVKMIAKVDADKKIYEAERKEGEGWLDVRNIGGLLESAPGEAAEQKRLAEESFWDNVGPTTENALIDAVNVFLNQLAISLFQNLMRNIAGDSSTHTSPYDWSSFDSESYSGGREGMQERFAEIVVPDFNIRGDYDVLAELTICSDPTNAGPTNCVIDDKFRQAIQEKVTVAEAIENGYLNANGTFGFLSDSLEPSYTEAYPYRSMIILRKFRILPVGWEVAAQFLKDNIGVNTTVNGSKNLGEMIACFDPEDDYKGLNDDGSEWWCQGLVDPNWVLKAPLNYCGREGYGSYVLNETITGDGDDSKILLSRADDYCADEQGCIKEHDDGSCEAYGYCTEEKRKWNFGSDSCDPFFNTCQTFTNQESGQTSSFLKNTLSYCDNPGCVAYCSDYDYLNDEYCADPSDSRIYLNSAAECDAADEGCHEFMRTNDGLGTNLMYNSSYEGTVVPTAVSAQDCSGGAANAVYGECVLELTGDNLNTFDLFDGFDYDYEGQIFTFSVYAKGCGNNVEIGIGGDPTWTSNYSTSTFATNGNWQRFSVSHLFESANSLEISIVSRDGGFPATGCFIDAGQIERGESPTAYKNYSDGEIIYEKLLPDYLEEVCYQSTVPTSAGYNQYIDDAPAVCYDFARKCSKDEVDCDLYRSTTDNITYPAKVTVDDFCPQDCVGYSEYLQKTSAFDSPSIAFMIPDRAKTCNSSANGCTEFTNLDKIGDGAENVEYYTELKHCITSSDMAPNADCSDYYTWEGTEESGFQLRVHKLKRDITDINGNGDTAEPTVVEEDTNECNSDIFNKLVTDPGYNFDCREFYDSKGEVTYHLKSRVVSCSDNCHPYRRTDYNVIKNYLGLNIEKSECLVGNIEYFPVGTIGNANQADGDEGEQVHYNDSNGECIFCKAGGVWNNEHGACLYNAIPGEGIDCNAGQAGCREYTGSTGNDMEILLNDDLDSTNIVAYLGWVNSSSGNTSGLSYSSSYHFSSGASSLMFNGGASSDYGIRKTLDNIIETGKAYHLSFIARPDGDLTNTDNAKKITSVGFDNGSHFEEFLTEGNVTMLPNDWRKYEFSLSSLSHLASSTELLVIKMDGDFMIDNIQLIKTTERFYLIKDSWETPDDCYHDIFGAPVGERYNLGCDEYVNTNDVYYYLRQFSKACQESAVGCELMVDTHNYSIATAESWYDPNDDKICDPAVEGHECEAVVADELIYMVYNQDMICAESNKGCSLLGEIDTYDNGVDTTDLFEDVYRINNPDLYDTMLCTPEEQDCKNWLVDGGEVAFRDPGAKYCIYDDGNWIQNKVSRCDDGANFSLVNGEIDRNIVAPFEALEYNVCNSSGDCDIIPGDISCDEDADCGVSAIPGGSYACVSGACHYQCLADDFDYACPTDREYMQVKTFGTGGYAVNQPTNSWAGACPASESGCTEFIDPMTSFGTNIILNSNFKETDSTGVFPNWPDLGGGVRKQNVSLKTNTLYSLSTKTGSGGLAGILTLDTTVGNAFKVLDQSNVLLGGVSSLDLDFAPAAVPNERLTSIFYLDEASEEEIVATITVPDSLFSLVHENEVFLRETAVGYRFSQEIEACTGNVDFEAGCILFNKRDVVASSLGLEYSTLEFDADQNENSPVAVDPFPCAGTNCDSSNMYLVTPDRVCGEWLACRSFIKDEEENNVCFDVGLCNRFNEMNNCGHFINDVQENQTYLVNESAATIANMTGYSQVGYGDNSLSGDYYPISTMEQIGSIARTEYSGDFELHGDNNYPLGWNVWDDGTGSSWTDDRFSVIDNPVAAQNEGIDYPVQGKALLSYSPSLGRVESDFIDVEPNTEYILSAKINTLNFSTGSGCDEIAVGMHVITYDGNDVPSGLNDNGNDFLISQHQTCGSDHPERNGCAVYVKEGRDWGNYNVRFTVGSETRKVRLLMLGTAWFGGGYAIGPGGAGSDDDYACHPNFGCDAEAFSVSGIPFVHNSCYSDSTDPSYNAANYTSTIEISADACSGNAYFDDIRMMPALVSRDIVTGGSLDNGNQDEVRNISQECRLYPEDDSLSCSYAEDSGIRKKGWYGHCLEFDRSPGNSDTCLLWYPVDNLKGQGIEEGAGYLDRYPIYYTTDSATERVYEYRHAFLEGSCQGNGQCCKEEGLCPTGYTGQMFYCKEVSGGWFGTGEDKHWCLCEPDGEDAITLDGSDDNWFHQDYDCNGTEGWKLNNPVSDNDGWYPYDGVQTYDKPVQIFSSAWDPAEDTPDERNISNPYTPYLCSGADTCVLSSELFRARAYATEVYQTVTPTAKNKYWRGRIFMESSHVIYGGSANEIRYSADYSPFGSIIPPGGENYSIVSNPVEWDSDYSSNAKQPVFYELPDKSLTEPYQSRAGELYKCTPTEVDDCKYVLSMVASDPFPYSAMDFSSRVGAQSSEVIQHLFAESYGRWVWTGDAQAGSYSKELNGGWVPPVTVCPLDPSNGNKPTRPGYDESALAASYCGIPPLVDYIAIDGIVGRDIDPASGAVVNLNTVVTLNKYGFVNFTFTSNVDVMQLPLVMYSVNWGDKDSLTVGGIEMRDRSSLGNPHSIYHVYDYWHLRSNLNVDNDTIFCGVAGSNVGSNDSAPNKIFNMSPLPTSNWCGVVPTVRIKDNWGWCNHGISGLICPTDSLDYGTAVVVLEE